MENLIALLEYVVIFSMVIVFSLAFRWVCDLKDRLVAKYFPRKPQVQADQQAPHRSKAEADKLKVGAIAGSLAAIMALENKDEIMSELREHTPSFDWEGLFGDKLFSLLEPDITEEIIMELILESNANYLDEMLDEMNNFSSFMGFDSIQSDLFSYIDHDAFSEVQSGFDDHHSTFDLDSNSSFDDRW